MSVIPFFSAVLVGMILFNSAWADDNVHFSGVLVAEPCTLPESDTDIKLDFGSVIKKSLYQYQRTKSQPFTIHLEDCDPSLMSTVNVTFGGTEDTELNTMLALDPLSSAKGVAIGFEQSDGTPLAINTAGMYQQLTQGNNMLIFNAYLQVTPSAMSTKTIVSGDFTAVSTFILAYQ